MHTHASLNVSTVFERASAPQFKALIHDLRLSDVRYRNNLSLLEHYESYDCYINTDVSAGYALSKSPSRWGAFELANVFSTVTGTGKFAVLDAIKRQESLWLCCYSGLENFYRNSGFNVMKTEKNWVRGGPDVVYMNHFSKG